MIRIYVQSGCSLLTGTNAVVRAATRQFNFTPFFEKKICKNAKFYRFLNRKQSTPLCSNGRYSDPTGSPGCTTLVLAKGGKWCLLGWPVATRVLQRPIFSETT